MVICIIGTVSSSLLGFRKSFLKRLVNDGHIVHVFSSDLTPQTSEALSEVGVIPHFYYLSRSSINPLNDLRTLMSLLSKLRKIKCDVVFSYFVKPVIFGTLAARLAGVPKIFAMIEGLGYVFTDKKDGNSFNIKFIRIIQVLLYKLSLPFATKVILLNKDDQNDLENLGCLSRGRGVVLGPIGLELEEYAHTPIFPTKVVFIFVGRLLEEKGIGYYLEAAEKLNYLSENVVFKVVGSVDPSNPGTVSEDKLKYLDSLGIIDYVGQVNNVFEQLAKSSVFVLPSYYREGFPRSTQEAMSVGRAVITTDVPGCRDTVVNGVNGYLVEPHSVPKLVEAMLEFVNEPDKILTMGQQSRSIAVSNFDVDKANLRLLQIMEIA
jgi:glycosyltransferase involved in cell wall biosynthesis